MRTTQDEGDSWLRFVMTAGPALSLAIAACVARPMPPPSTAAGIATSAPAVTPPPAPSPHLSGPVACRPGGLAFRAGRDGATGVVHIGGAISNIDDTACSLPVVPVRIELVPASGTALPLRVEPAVGDPSARILIPPGVDDGADLIAYWTNWCGGAIGPLELGITFQIGEADVHANLDGSLLARCDNPAGPSTIQIDSVMTASP